MLICTSKAPQDLEPHATRHFSVEPLFTLLLTNECYSHLALCFYFTMMLFVVQVR